MESVKSLVGVWEFNLDLLSGPRAPRFPWSQGANELEVEEAVSTSAGIGPHTSVIGATPVTREEHKARKDKAGLARGFLTKGDRKGLEVSKRKPPGHYWATPPSRYVFAQASTLSTCGKEFVEQLGSVEKSKGVCKFYRLPGIVNIDSVGRILQHCKQSRAYKTDVDSVDQTPTFEYYPMKDGEWADHGLREILADTIDSILPYVRERFACEFCAVSDILVRRYLPGERRTHGVHFDGHAFVTAVLGLTSPDDYEGGLFVQPDAGIASRMFFRLEPGDLLLHSFDLQHGVHIWKGTRYSLIFWVKDSLQSVRDRSTPWYDTADDADALYNVAQNHEHGLGRPVDVEKAIHLYEKSASLGHHFALNNLGLIYRRLHEQGHAAALARSVDCLQRAAETGFAMAQKNLSLAYANGHGVKRDDVQAVVWMRRAAEQLEVEAAYKMGEFYRIGRGVPQDSCKAAMWFERSADAGFPKAQWTLGMMYLEGTGVTKDLEKAELWMGFAARQGNAEAKNNLATLCAQRGNMKSAAEIWAELAKLGEPNAQCNIGMCYMRGVGRDRDLAKAKFWLTKAAAQRHEMAAQALTQL